MNFNNTTQIFKKIPKKNFEMAIYPVTQAQYEGVMGTNPSYFKETMYAPVEMVSYEDALNFISKLNSSQKKYVYRLPTEEEWEYCCRAGSETEYCFGDDPSSLKNYAWFNENSNGKTHPVTLKKPNKWGLYDMHGNVWEWISSLYDGVGSGSYRVIRGGSWFSTAQYLRSAYRGHAKPGDRNDYVGFRLVRTLSNSLSSNTFVPRRRAPKVASALKKIEAIERKLKELKESLK